MALGNAIIWIDAQGQRVLHVVTVASAVGSIETALLNHSQADIVQQFGGTVANASVAPGVATYPTVRVTAVLYFADATGSIGKLFLPAPDANIFLPDGDTVDPTAIPDIISAAVGQLLAGSGSPVVAFTGGKLIQTRFSGIETT